MKIKYTGSESMIDIFGDWYPGDVKEVPDRYPVNWNLFEPDTRPKIKRGRPRKMKEALSDKMERDNVEISGDSITAPDGELKNGGTE